jgi:predicted ArsR family transcriptional regulator
MVSGIVVPTEVQPTTPATRLVYLILRDAPPLPVEEVAKRTALSRRSVKRSLGALRERDLVEARRHPSDGRRKLYAATARQAGATPGASDTRISSEDGREAVNDPIRPVDPRGIRR